MIGTWEEKPKMLYSTLDSEGSGGALPLRDLLEFLSIFLLPYAELSSKLFPVILDAEFSLLGQKQKKKKIPTLAVCDLPAPEGRKRDWSCVACQF